MKKEDKDFFENNKNWIFMIILSIFITNIGYLTMFEDVIVNGIINISVGLIIIILLCLFYKEEKAWINSNSQLYRILVMVLLAAGIISSFYHIGYAIGQMII